MSTALVLALAMALDAVTGEPRWLWTRVPHPAVLMGRVVAVLDTRLNTGTARQARGAFAVLILVCLSLGMGLILARFGPVVEILCAAILLAQKSLVQHVRDVSDSLRQSLPDARRAVAMIVSRDCTGMTEPQIARAAIESASENLSDGVIAPAFWFMVGGLPGLLIYKIVNTADSMIGYRTARYRDFGRAAARLDDLLNLVPARLTGLLIAVLSGHAGQWSDITADARRHVSPNAGWPEAAMARALDLALAGPRSYDGQMRDLAWVNGSARRDIGADDVDAAIAMLWRVWSAAFAVVIAIACLGALTLV